MISLLIVLSFAQFGPDSRTICLDNVERLEQIVMQSANCQWVADSDLPSSAPDLPPPPTYYNAQTGQCQGTFECTSPFPETDQTYRIINAFCTMLRPPPGGVCNVMSTDCKSSFVTIERNQCNSIQLQSP